jgi:hypothetical protein
MRFPSRFSADGRGAIPVAKLRAWFNYFGDDAVVLPPQRDEDRDLLIIGSTAGLPPGWWVPVAVVNVREERLKWIELRQLAELRQSPAHEHDAETWCAAHRPPPAPTPALAATGGHDGR